MRNKIIGLYAALISVNVVIWGLALLASGPHPVVRGERPNPLACRVAQAEKTAAPKPEREGLLEAVVEAAVEEPAADRREADAEAAGVASAAGFADREYCPAPILSA